MSMNKTQFVSMWKLFNNDMVIGLWPMDYDTSLGVYVPGPRLDVSTTLGVSEPLRRFSSSIMFYVLCTFKAPSDMAETMVWWIVFEQIVFGC